MPVLHGNHVDRQTAGEHQADAGVAETPGAETTQAGSGTQSLELVGVPPVLDEGSVCPNQGSLDILPPEVLETAGRLPWSLVPQSHSLVPGVWFWVAVEFGGSPGWSPVGVSFLSSLLA